MLRHLGPILRSLTRRKSVFALVVLELASGFTIISCLTLTGAYFLHNGETTSGHEEASLILALIDEAVVGGGSGAEIRAAAQARREADRARLLAVPGVKEVATVASTLLDDRWDYPSEFLVSPSGFAGPPGDAGPARPVFGRSIRVSANAPAVLGLRLREGRLPQAGEEHPRGTVLTRSLREALFPDGHPAVGQAIVSEDAAPSTVLAVVEDVHLRIPFVIAAQAIALRFEEPRDERFRQLLVKVDPGRRDQLLPAVAAALGPSRPDRLVEVRPFDSGRGIHAHAAHGILVILGIMAVSVALIALLGALAVASFLVAERTRQIGIRRALGATRQDVIRHFLLENTIALAVGTALGVLLTVSLYTPMRQVFPGIQLDPRFLLVTGLLLWIDATAAALVPARRAARIPPSVASRATSLT